MFSVWRASISNQEAGSQGQMSRDKGEASRGAWHVKVLGKAWYDRTSLI